MAAPSGRTVRRRPVVPSAAVVQMVAAPVAREVGQRFLPQGQPVLAPAAVAAAVVAQLVPVAFAARQPVARRALVGAWPLVAAGTDRVVPVSWSGSTGFAARTVGAVPVFRQQPPLQQRELPAAVLWRRAVPVIPASNQGHADVAPANPVGSVVLPAGKPVDAEVAEVAAPSGVVPLLVRPGRGPLAQVPAQRAAVPVGAAPLVVVRTAAAVVVPVVVAVEIVVVAASLPASWAAAVEADAEPAIPFASRSVRRIPSSSLVGLVLAVPGRLPRGLAASAACAVRRSAEQRGRPGVVLSAHPGRAAEAAARLVLARRRPLARRLPERSWVVAAGRLARMGAHLQAAGAVRAREAAVVEDRWAFL